jgi:hypothetical protein
MFLKGKESINRNNFSSVVEQVHSDRFISPRSVALSHLPLPINVLENQLDFQLYSHFSLDYPIHLNQIN